MNQGYPRKPSKKKVYVSSVVYPKGTPKDVSCKAMWCSRTEVELSTGQSSQMAFVIGGMSTMSVNSGEFLIKMTNQHRCLSGPTLHSRWKQPFNTITHVHMLSVVSLHPPLKKGENYSNILRTHRPKPVRITTSTVHWKTEKHTKFTSNWITLWPMSKRWSPPRIVTLSPTESTDWQIIERQSLK